MKSAIAKIPATKGAALYDVLFCTRDEALWNEYTLFFQHEQDHLRVGYVNAPDAMKVVRQRLSPNGLILMDIRYITAENEGGVPVSGQPTEENVVAVGFSESGDLPAHCVGGMWQGLDAVIPAGKPAADNWSRILHIQHSLRNPLMSLRIQDVAVNDILQLLAMGDRSAVVSIKGQRESGESLIQGRIYFEKGALLFAISSTNTGDQAVYDLLSLRFGTIRVLAGFWVPGWRNVLASLDQIFLNYAVECDEALAESPASPAIALPAVAAHAPKPEPIKPYLVPREALIAGSWGARTGREPSARFKGRSPLHVFCSLWKHLPSSSVEMVENAVEGHLPLEWMTPDLLAQQLDARLEQRVLALTGSLEFLICILASWQDRFLVEQMEAGRRPVIRVNGSDADSVWIVGNLEDQPLDLLLDYPEAVWTEPRSADGALRTSVDQGHPAVILLTSDLRLGSMSVNWGVAFQGPAPMPYDLIIARADSWNHVRDTLGDPLKALKKIAAHCRAG